MSRCPGLWLPRFVVLWGIVGSTWAAEPAAKSSEESAGSPQPRIR